MIDKKVSLTFYFIKYNIIKTMKLAGSLLAALVVSTYGNHVDQLLDELRDGCINVVQSGPFSTRTKAKFPNKLSVETKY